MNEDDLKNKSICECGNWIPEAIVTESIGPFVAVQSTVTQCDDCMFLEIYRDRMFKPRPYREPPPRPTQHNKMPASLRKKLEDYRAKKREAEERRKALMKGEL